MTKDVSLLTLPCPATLRGGATQNTEEEIDTPPPLAVPRSMAGHKNSIGKKTTFQSSPPVSCNDIGGVPKGRGG